MLSDLMKIAVLPRELHWLSKRILCLTAMLFVLLMLFSCATFSQTANHGFQFDIRGKDATVEVMDFRYGLSDLPGTRVPAWAKERSQPRGQTGIFGDFSIGNDLFVEWRIKATGETLRQTVDVKELLPKDLNGYTITFTIDEKLLEVFLVSPERRSSDFPIVGPPKYNELKVYRIFPANDLPNRLRQ